MNAPKIFIPKQRLMVPLGLESEVPLQLIAEVSPSVVPIASANFMITQYFGSYFSWEEDGDGLAGRVHLRESSTDIKIPLAYFDIESGTRTSHYGTDGRRIAQDDKTVVSYGCRYNDMLSIWWGVTTVPLTPDASFADVNFYYVCGDSDFSKKTDVAFRGLYSG